MYYSQSGQDKFLNEIIFKNKRNGSFVDIGANDGITYSNSYFFENELNWRGVCLEPIPAVFEKLNKLRKSININCCIAPQEGIKEFLLVEGYAEMLSGLVENYDDRHLKRIEKEIKDFGGRANKINLPCRNLNNLLNEQKFTKIDYCSIDTEGGEFEILKSIDFKQISINVFSIENNYKESDMRYYMEFNGYELITTLEADEIYSKKKSKLQSFFRW